MNLVTNPDWETVGGWGYTGGAYRDTANPYWAHRGDAYAALISRSGYLQSGEPPTMTADLALTAGHRCQVRAYVQPWGFHGDPLEVLINNGSGALAQQGMRVAGAAVYEWWNLGAFIATGAAGQIRFKSYNADETSQGWHIDDVYVIDPEGDVAVKLAERAIDAIITTLQDNIATELTAIDTERGDGITMTAPGSSDYHKYPKNPIGGSRCQVEVFESNFDFLEPWPDAQSRALYTIPITVRFTVFNEGGELASVMSTRMRRYTAAAFNVFSGNPTLGDDAIHIANTARIDPHWEMHGEDADKVAKVQVSFYMDIRCEEVQS